VRWLVEEKFCVDLKVSPATMTGQAELDRARQGGRKERFCSAHCDNNCSECGFDGFGNKERDRDQAKATTFNFSNTKEDPDCQCYSLNGTASFPIAITGAPFSIRTFKSLKRGKQEMSFEGDRLTESIAKKMLH
jgi:hypothetical protein